MFSNSIDKNQSNLSHQNKICGEIILNNNDLYDIDEGPEEEQQNILSNKMQIDQTEDFTHKIDEIPRKRKNLDKFDHKKEENKEDFISKNKKIKPQQKENSTIDGLSNPDKQALETNKESKTNIQEQNISKKILKKRKVKKTETYKDEEGFDVTRDIYVEEEYLADDTSEGTLLSNNFKNNLQLNNNSSNNNANEVKNNKPATGKNKNNVGQKSIVNFFKK